MASAHDLLLERARKIQGQQRIRPSVPFFEKGKGYWGNLGRQVGPPAPLPQKARPRFDAETAMQLPAEWSYKEHNATDRLGPYGEQLPFGAESWDPYGRPYYGDGLKGWYKGFASRMLAPIQGVDLGEGKIPDFFQNMLPNAAKTFGVMPLSKYLSNVGSEEGGAISPTTFALRGANELVRMGLQLMQEPAIKTEQAISVAGEQELLGAGSPIPEFRLPFNLPMTPFNSPLPPQFIDQMPEHIQPFLRALNPGNLLVNVTRMMTSPISAKEKGSRLEDAYQAGRVLYSSAVDASLRSEYIRRLNAGENPYFLAMEMENPMAEMAGQLVFDPLNIIGTGTRAIRDQKRVNKVIQEFYKIVPDVEEALRAANVTSDARAVTAIQNLGEATIRGFKKMSEDYRLRALTAAGKRHVVGMRTGELAGWIVSNAQDDEQAAEALLALARMASSDVDEIAQGFATAKHFLDPKPLLSRAGNELGAVLRRALTDPETGEFTARSAQKFLDDMARAQQEGAPAVIDFLGKKAYGAIQDFLPDLNVKLERGAIIPWQYKAINNMHDLAQKAVYKPVNSFLSGIYMGLSPGYVARNLTTNTVQIFADYGPAAFKNWKRSTLLRQTKEYLGGLVPKGVQGMSGGTTGVETYKALQGLPGIRAAELEEEMGAAQVVFKSVSDTMRKMLRPGRALPDIRELVNAGLPEASARQMVQMVIDAKGDVRRAVAAFREAAQTGSVEAWRTLAWLNPADDSALRGLNLIEQLQEAVQAPTLEEAARIFNAAVDEVIHDAGRVAQEIPAIADDAEDLHVVQAMTGHVTNDVMRDVTSHKQAYAQVRALYERSIREAFQGMQMPPEIASTMIEAPAQILDESQSFTDRIWALYQSWLRMPPSRGGWAELWRTTGIPGDPPAGLTKETLIDALWNDYYRPTQLRRWSAFSQGYAQFAEDAIATANPTPLVEEARRALALGRQWDDYVFGGMRGASPTGAPAAAAEGVAEVAAAPARAFVGRTGTLPKEIVLEGEEELTALAKSALDKLPEPLRTGFKKLKIEFSDETVAAKNTGGRIIFSPDKKVVSEEIMTHELLHSFQGKYYQDFGKGVPSAGKVDAWASGAIARGEGIELETISALREDWVASIHAYMSEKYGLPGEGFDDAIRSKWLTEGQVAERRTYFDNFFAQAVPRPPIPYAGGTPTLARTMTEQLTGINDLRARVLNQLSGIWGQVEPVVIDANIDHAISGWAKTAEKNVAKARLIAANVADEARKFTLLSYPEKTYFDLALAYIYPYHFWYTRTYTNWLKRIVQTPEVLAGYAKYRDAMAKIHAGAPNWWKYNINSNELLGRDDENPFFFNLEATFNPLNGMTGVDFNDPRKRINWWTATLDDLGKFGPSTWTPYSMATALALYLTGEQEAAARWGPRLIPQTATLKAATHLLNIGPPGGLEIDPATLFFAGGVDPYERNRIGRMLTVMVENDQISEAQAAEAAYRQSGPIWDMAKEQSASARAPGQISSFLFGAGFRARNLTDLQVDRFYSEYYNLWDLKDSMSDEEFQDAMDGMRLDYPFMDTLLLSRKASPLRDRSYAYSVMGRIPPGQQDELFKAVGLDPRLGDKFWDTNGYVNEWPETDRTRFMAAIVDMGALLDMPDDATKAEWNEAKDRYKEIDGMLEELFNDPGLIVQQIARYYSMRDTDKDAANDYADSTSVGAALQWRDAYIMNDPLLSKYYSSLSKIDMYYDGIMYDALDRKFPNIQTVWDGYDVAKLAGEGTKYWKAHPELKEYLNMLYSYQEITAKMIANASEALPEKPLPFLQPGVTPESLGEQDITGYIEEPSQTVYDYTWNDWSRMMSPSLSNLVMDYVFTDEKLNSTARDQLEYIAEQEGISSDVMLELMRRALEGR